MVQFKLKLKRVVVLSACAVFSQSIFAMDCSDYLAGEISISFAKQYHQEAEFSAKSRSKSKVEFFDSLPSFIPRTKLQIEYLLTQLENGLPRSLSFDIGFSLATFKNKYPDSNPNLIQLASVSLTQNTGLTDAVYYLNLPREWAVSGVSNADYSVFLFASTLGTKPLDLGTPASARSVDHSMTPQWVNRKKVRDGFPGDKLYDFTKSGFVLNSRDGIVIGGDKDNFLSAMFAALDAGDVEGSQTAAGIGVSRFLDSQGHPISVGSTLFPKLSPNDILYDARSDTFAIRARKAHQQASKGEARYYILRINPDGTRQIDPESVFDTHEPLPFSFAYLPHSKFVAFRDNIGNFFINHSHKARDTESSLYKIKLPRNLKKKGAISDADTADLSFPKVVSVLEESGEKFVILNRNGNMIVWDSQTAKNKIFELNLEFNRAESEKIKSNKKRGIEDSSVVVPGLADGASLNFDGQLLAVWGKKCVKLFSTVEGYELRKFTLPKSHEDQVQSAMFTPDATAVLVTYKDNSATLIEVKTGRIVMNLTPQMGDQFRHALSDHNMSYYYNPASDADAP